LDIVLLTSVIFAQKEQELKWVISMPALSQKIPALKGCDLAHAHWRTNLCLLDNENINKCKMSL